MSTVQNHTKWDISKQFFFNNVLQKHYNKNVYKVLEIL